MRTCSFQLALYYCVAFSFAAADITVSEGLDYKWLERADKDVVFPVRIDPDTGLRTWNLLPTRQPRTGAGRTKRDATEKSIEIYRLNGFGIDYELQVTPNGELLSPSAFVQTMQVGSSGREEVLTEDIEDEGCHLTGWARTSEGVNNTLWGRAAISVCDGNMTGLLKMSDYEMHIDVLSDGETPMQAGQAHILHRRSAGSDEFEEGHQCNVAETDDVQGAHDETTHSQHLKSKGKSRTARQAPNSHILYVETLIVVDKIMISNREMNNRQLKNYVLMMMNIANMLWTNKATGFDVRFVVLRLMFLKQTPTTLTLSTSSVELMKSFCVWQNSVNSPNEESLAHHDYAILLTGNELCVNGNCELGRAYVSAMCRPKYACHVASDAGIRTGYVIAHESGHSFGMYHDGQGNRCSGKQRRLMAAQVSSLTDIFNWSPCSQEYIRDFLKDKQYYECLLDAPPHRFLRFADRWAGLRYDIDQQCSFQVGKKTTVCPYSSAKKRICQELWCRENQGCTTVYIPALDGSTCAENKVCVRSQCVLESEKDNYTRLDAPIHGEWSSWSKVSSCSKSCGGGLRHQLRECNNPAPSNGARICEGIKYMLELCNTLPCAKDPIDPRVRLCQTIKDDNGDAMQPYYHDRLPCHLFCFNTATSKVQRMTAAIANGTKCVPNTKSNDRCFNGQCEKFGCDNNWKSKAAEDNCRICQGTGRSCRVRSGTFDYPIANFGYHEVVEIPSQARDIFIEETTISDDLYLAIKLQSRRLHQFVLNGNKRPGPAWRRVAASGSVIEYSRPAYGSETIKINGPLQLPIQIMVLFTQSRVIFHPTIKWQYAMTSGRRDPGTGDYAHIWKKTEASCSKTCKGGVRQVSYHCYSTQGGLLVNYKFCDRAAVRPPKTQTVPCNANVPCRRLAPSYRWQTGEWGRCSSTCGKSQQQRKVLCHDATSAAYVDQSNCKDRAPPAQRSCSVPACPKPIHGGWTDWKPFSACTKSCGSGVWVERRACTNPRPKNGGKTCFGASKRYRCCNSEVCKTKDRVTTNDFTSQCEKQYPRSKAVFSADDLSRCQIKCQLESGSIKRIDAEDATRCDLRSSRRCFNHACLPVGCNCVYGSAMQSPCGLCARSSAKCSFVSAKYRIQHSIARDYHVVDVPKGAYRLRIRMMKGSKLAASIVIRSFSGEKLQSSDFLGDLSRSKFAFGGEVSYSSSSNNHDESLMFYGPAEEDLEIFLLLEERVIGRQSPKIDVTYLITSEYKQKADELNSPYGWKLANIGCSVTCDTGAGFEAWNPQCAHKQTGKHADISQCSTDYKPRRVKGEACKGRGNCPGVTWQANPWRACSVSCGSGQQTRIVRCVSISTQVAKEEELCDPGLKPFSTRQCVSRDCPGLVQPTPTLPVLVSPPPFYWEVKQWRSCSVTCGQGTQTRTVRCTDRRTGNGKNVRKCEGMPKPLDRRVCSAGPCIRPTTALPTSSPTTTSPASTASSSRFLWFAYNWKPCNATCGVGYQMRAVRCIDRNTRASKNVRLCDGNARPVNMRQCTRKECPTVSVVQPCTTEPPFCSAVSNSGLCEEPNFVGKCCKSCL